LIEYSTVRAEQISMGEFPLQSALGLGAARERSVPRTVELR